jgi:hypothetical protein
LHDKSFTSLAVQAVSYEESRLIAVELPWQTKKTSVVNLVRESYGIPDVQLQTCTSATDTAFIFHTSGTSTGFPKPIIQSHHAAFRVLPAFKGRQNATFTTTPLYHGGIADCLRAWSSGALIWLFPAANIPITTQNVISSLSIANKATTEISAECIKYFSSVPYVLQMLAEDSLGHSMLVSMEIVGVGGAALSTNVGNDLVRSGINLISRFGSAECGFLLASHRDYQTDKDWQYLRLSPASDWLCFEEQDDGSGLFELVVKKSWPHVAKSNREDGSFATHDLFEPHKLTEGAWKYHSRSDSQITLNTGKKFDPAPLEDTIASSSRLIKDVLIFGTGRNNPGALIIPSKEKSSVQGSESGKKIWEVVQLINSKGQDHTRIYRDKLIIVSADQPPFERSSKGTLLRGVIERRFAEIINKPHVRNPAPEIEHIENSMKDGDIMAFVRTTVANLNGSEGELKDDTDFYTHGMNSATCTQIRSILQKASQMFIFQLIDSFGSLILRTLCKIKSNSLGTLYTTVEISIGNVRQIHGTALLTD